MPRLSWIRCGLAPHPQRPLRPEQQTPGGKGQHQQQAADIADKTLRPLFAPQQESPPCTTTTKVVLFNGLRSPLPLAWSAQRSSPSEYLTVAFALHSRYWRPQHPPSRRRRPEASGGLHKVNGQCAASCRRRMRGGRRAGRASSASAPAPRTRMGRCRLAWRRRSRA